MADDVYSDSDVEFLASICIARTRELERRSRVNSAPEDSAKFQAQPTSTWTDSQATECMLKLLDDPIRVSEAAPESERSCSSRHVLILPIPGRGYTPSWMLGDGSASSSAPSGRLGKNSASSSDGTSSLALSGMLDDGADAAADTQLLQQLLQEEDARLFASSTQKASPKAPLKVPLKEHEMPKGVIWSKMLSASAALAPGPILLDSLHDQIARPASLA